VIERGVILAANHSAIDASQLFTSGERFESQHFTIGPGGQFVRRDPSQLIEETASESEGERAFRSIGNLLRGMHDDKDRISFDEIESLLLRKAVECSDGNISAAARLLGMTRPQMVYRLKSRGIIDDHK
ncbi:MAG: hypothetical protein KDE45_09755, partial [Caldilineaceae bacterium]|nr:hypothetical protein [Caldilineaceae bacterium]